MSPPASHLRSRLCAISETDLARLQLPGPKKLQCMPLLDVLEQRLSFTQDDGMYDQPEFVDQAPVHQTANQGGTANGMYVLAGLLFCPPDLLDVSNDPRVLPGDVVESAGQDDMGRLFREVCVSDLA